MKLNTVSTQHPPDRPVPRAESTMTPMQGRWPPGKMCSRMKSEDLQYASYRSSGSAMTWGAEGKLTRLID